MIRGVCRGSFVHLIEVSFTVTDNKELVCLGFQENIKASKLLFPPP